MDLRLLQPAPNAAEQQPHDLRQLLIGQRLEDDDLVDPVQELRPEMLAQLESHILRRLVEGGAAALRGIDQRR